MATFTVTIGGDETNATDGLMTLREAVTAAQNNAGTDTIVFSAALDDQTIELKAQITIVANHTLIINGDRDNDGIADVAIGTDASFGSNHFTVALNGNLTLIGLDLRDGFAVGNTGSNGANGAGGANGTTGAPGVFNGLDQPAHQDGGDGADGTNGGNGTSGARGQDAAGSIYNFGTLTLVRVGFSGNSAAGANGGSGGTGGDGGAGGAGGAGYHGSETPESTLNYGPGGTPIPHDPFWTYDEQDRIISAAGSISSSGPVDELDVENYHPWGGNGGDGGDGADGGDGGQGGDGGDAASAVINSGTLTLVDVSFGGILANGTVGSFGAASAGTGGVGGRAGRGMWGGTGGEGGQGGLYWSKVYFYGANPPGSGEGSPQQVFYYKTDAGGHGGAGGNSGDNGNNGVNGNGGNASSSIVNRGTVTGSAAIDIFGVTSAGTGGSTIPTLWGAPLTASGGGGGLQEFDEWDRGAGGQPAILTGWTPVPGWAPDVQDDPTYSRAASGQNGFGGTTGTPGAIGGTGTASSSSVVNVGGGSASVASGRALVYVHQLPRETGADEIIFNIIRRGTTSGGPIEVDWRIVGGPTGDKVEAADFVGGVLPSGTVSLAWNDNVEQITVTLTPRAANSATETYRIELTEATNNTVSVALGTHIIDGQVGPAAPALVVINGTPGPNLIDATHSPAGQPKPTGVANLINGRGGDDTLHGLGGADTINGQGGKDKLFGEAGGDTLNGGAGADKLTGGAGTDTLTGGAAADRFNFSGHWGKDTITDFVEGAAKNDVIALPKAWFKNFAAVKAAASVDVNHHVVIKHGADWITLNSVSRVIDLHANDFLFV